MYVREVSSDRVVTRLLRGVLDREAALTATEPL